MSSSFSAEERSCKPVVNNKLEKIKNGFYVGNGVRGDRVVGDVDALFEQACMASEWAIQKTDCLLSMFRYPAEYLEEVRQTRRARGSDGVHWGPFLWFDIDRENDLPAAVRDTVSLVKYIVYVLSDEKRDFTSENLQIWFSGCKGFHLGLPIQIFGDDILPREGFGKLCKAVAERLDKEAGVTIDSNVYDFVRLLRCPNTRHKTTWLYKIPVTLAELESENAVAMIHRRAKYPRRLVTNGIWCVAGHPSAGISRNLAFQGT